MGPRPPSLKANVTWTLWGNIISAGCQWGMIVAIAKLGNPTMVGQYAYALAIVAPLVLFLNLQLRAIQATDVRTEFQFGNYFAVRLITIGVTWIVVFGIIAFARYDAATSLTLLGVTLTKCL